MMDVTVYLKNGKVFNFGETAIFTDEEANWAVLSIGKVTGNRPSLRWPNSDKYTFKDETHIALSWDMVDRIEVRSTNAASKS